MTRGMVLALLAAALGAEAAAPSGLRCEHRRDPLGVDAPSPRLSWLMTPSSADARGERQSAWQVLVASTPAQLALEKGDLWDSGKVLSAQSSLVRYAGRQLPSGQQCFWKVRAWAGDGKASPWSQPARWTMGLLRASDWKGAWIGKEEPEKSATLEGTQWIWFPEANPAAAAPPGVRFFRRVVTLPADRVLRRAQVWLTADDELELSVNGRRVASGNNFHAAELVELTWALAPGPNVLAVRVKNGGAVANPAGLVALLQLDFATGEPLTVATDAAWKTSATAPAGWEQAGFDDSGWVAARVLGAVGVAPWGVVERPAERRLAARWLRKEFSVDKKVRRATASLSGLGLSELWLNGRKVGDHVLSPGLTEYPKRVLYVTHDVTGQLVKGANALGVVLGNGRFYAPRLTVPTQTRTFGQPRLLLQLSVEYEDGSTSSVVSDESWRLTTAGPIRAGSEYDGEEYDARLELDGWAAPGFDDSKWERPQRVAAPGGVLAAQMIEPIRVTQALKPLSVKAQQPGVWVFDLGQNISGWCRLRVRGPAGTELTLRHAERLRPDGSLWVENLRSALATDRYTLRGKGVETWEPRFTSHGFRYVELRGFPGKPELSTLEGRVVHDDLERAGEWSSSNPTLNRVFENVRWSVRGNYRSIPTDCPQRDERQGWLGDRASQSRGEAWLFDVAALYAKWLQDIADAQQETGSVSDVSPAYWPRYTDNATWPSSTVTIPGELLELYGDADVLARHYPSMKRWVDYMSGFLEGDLMPRDTYGDWGAPPEDPKLIHTKDPARQTAPALLGTASFFHSLTLMARYATLLGKRDDAQRYQRLADRLKAGFNRRFLAPDGGRYDNGSQTSSVVPLAVGLVPAEHRARVFGTLVGSIAEAKGHLGTGVVGGQWLMRTLTAEGRADLALSLATTRSWPGWGYMVDQGATTVWELWNGDTADASMSSGNHVMLVGDLVSWLFEDLAGIHPDLSQPGFKHLVLEPRLAGDLGSVKATHRSPYGLIKSEWKRSGGQLTWSVMVPPNTTATVLVPARDVASVTESGVPASKARGVTFIRKDAAHAVYEVGSGTYRWTSEPPLPLGRGPG